ncbi:MAG: ABC transporter ATP-binding protein [Lachnospiraceae bacterium]|nr:ABC transporter ATP-binding protein [Lachnospiraceae bacterium]
MKNDVIMEMKNLSVGYEDRVVVGGVDAVLYRGEILVLMGPNGAGKSTLLKTISGQLLPISGEVSLMGGSVFSMKPMERARHMSLLLTGQRMAEMMTCYDVVSMGRYPYTGRLGILSEDDKTVVAEAMERLDIAKLADKSFDKISDGQRQRVLLARALAQKPGVLMLDEPASHLDIKYQLELVEILRSLAGDGLSVIMSMHELLMVKKCANRLLCISEGRAEPVEDVQSFFDDGSVERLFDIPVGSL